MGLKTNRESLDRKKPLELVLELLSFAGGENTRGEDAALKSNEARTIENWDPISLGGMIRSKGFNEVADGGATYTDQPDLLFHHREGLTSTRIFMVIEGDVAYKNGAVITQTDNAAFTSGVLCSGLSAGDKAWITNSTDNLKYTTIAGNITVPADQPSSARDRIYEHKSRLVAEGGGKAVFGSRALQGNWTAADAWSLAGDAWSFTFPDNTKGAVMGFPSGHEIAVFTKNSCSVIYNFPNVARRELPTSHGCSAPDSIARGDEGVYFLSEFPTKGIFLWNGVTWTDLTINLPDFFNSINLAQRMFGEYRNRKYYFFYNESGSGVTYPNRVKIFDAEFGRWMSRPVNSALSDNFGYPAVLRYDNNELYVASSQKDKLYELETADNSDEDENTEANYKTKFFTSRDFAVASGGGNLPINDVRMKLTKITASYFGTQGSISILWISDKGRYQGSKTLDLTADGALINTTFTVNSSNIISSANLPEKNKTSSFNNAAVGRGFEFQILNSNTGTRPELKSIKIHAIAIEES